MTSSTKTQSETALNPPASNLIPFESWLASIGKTPATGWRWRQRGWIEVVNICGRIYVSRTEIVKFETRAAAGEFSKVHITPGRRTTAVGKEAAK